MLGLFQVVMSVGAWPGVHNMPSRVIVLRPIAVPLTFWSVVPRTSPDGAARFPKTAFRSFAGIAELDDGRKGSFAFSPSLLRRGGRGERLRARRPRRPLPPTPLSEAERGLRHSPCP